MANVKILSIGKDTGKRYDLMASREVSNGLFNVSNETYKMRLILYKETRGQDLNNIVDQVLDKKNDWKPSKNGGFHYRIPFVCSAFIANEDGEFAKKGKKSE